MNSTLLKKLLCVTAMALTPALVFAGGTNTEEDPTTGYKRDPGRSMEQGDMGSQGVGQESGSKRTSDPEQLNVDDSALTDRVEKALKNDAQLKNLDIDVEVEGGVVTLSGDAKDVRYQGRAAQVAKSVKGVKSVQNNLTVNGEKK